MLDNLPPLRSTVVTVIIIIPNANVLLCVKNAIVVFVAIVVIGIPVVINDSVENAVVIFVAIIVVGVAVVVEAVIIVIKKVNKILIDRIKDSVVIHVPIIIIEVVNEVFIDSIKDPVVIHISIVVVSKPDNAQIQIGRPKVRRKLAGPHGNDIDVIPRHIALELLDNGFSAIPDGAIWECTENDALPQVVNCGSSNQNSVRPCSIICEASDGKGAIVLYHYSATNIPIGTDHPRQQPNPWMETCTVGSNQPVITRSAILGAHDCSQSQSDEQTSEVLRCVAHRYLALASAPRNPALAFDGLCRPGLQ